ncbi:hypothetical protein [Mangrovactinospora gilvigrisea]|nr:hypothetical protein [Mangrovactinospora gilvigrisea]
MSGDISLTAFRGTKVADFLERLGADRQLIDQELPYREASERWPVEDDDSLCMYGTHGEWSYVIEGIGAASWYWLSIARDASAAGREGEELVCFHRGLPAGRPALSYCPGNGETWHAADFGESLRAGYRPPRPDPSGKVAALDAAMRAGGAVFGDRPDFSDDPRDNWPKRRAWTREAFTAIGAHLGLSVPRLSVVDGQLPAAVIPSFMR